MQSKSKPRFGSSGCLGDIMRQEILELRPFLFSRSITSSLTDSIRVIAPDLYETSPPFAANFNHVCHHGNLLAIADEEGSISVVKTDTFHLTQNILKWKAHHNAIFDILWSLDDSQILTASGDQSISCWDTMTRALKRSIGGTHSSSVKCLAVKPNETNIIASGGRDGNVFLWDLRLPDPVPIIRIRKDDKGKAKKRRRLSKLALPGSHEPQSESVTGLAFLPHGAHTIASTFAPSGDILLWDIRFQAKAESPFATLPHGEYHSTFHAFTSLTASSSSPILYGTSTDNHIYAYHAHASSQGPYQSWTSPEFDLKSFYIKSCLSADEQWLLTGSSSHKAYLWPVGMRSEGGQGPLFAISLHGHEGEVTSVAWSVHTPHTFATCSDDASVRVWKLDAGQAHQSEESPVRIKAIPVIQGQGILQLQKADTFMSTASSHLNKTRKISQFFTPTKPYALSKENSSPQTG